MMWVIFLFTFHNVSINTQKIPGTPETSYIFTFHNVSINTGFGTGRNSGRRSLYIPQCFY